MTHLVHFWMTFTIYQQQLYIFFFFFFRTNIRNHFSSPSGDFIELVPSFPLKWNDFIINLFSSSSLYDLKFPTSLTCELIIGSSFEMLVFFSFVVCYCIVGTFLHNIMKNELQRLRLICSLGWWKCFKRLNNIITLGWFTIKRVASSWLNRAAALKKCCPCAVQRPVSAWSIFGRGNF